ncbi:MAG: hypothetical protein ACYS8W_18360 [Planctomycetota bacterium]
MFNIKPRTCIFLICVLAAGFALSGCATQGTADNPEKPSASLSRASGNVALDAAPLARPVPETLRLRTYGGP